MNISQQRCFNHAEREAAAQCLACRRFFCRECATEHDGRVICASCLRELTTEAEDTGRPWLRYCWRTIQLSLGMLALWLFFYLVAQALLNAPSEYHQGKSWAEALAAEMGFEDKG